MHDTPLPADTPLTLSPMDAGRGNPALASSREQVSAWITHLSAGLLERELAVRLSLLAALSGEHVLLIGPPGTAKSALARRLHRAFEGAPYFERLLTRFSTPEELFGPLSLKALEDDRYERLSAGFLPSAGIAFLDEVFKANSAILNALLTLLNERAFDNGSGRQATPLVSVVAASNEVPVDDALQAFYDRFLLRVPVAPVSDAAFAALLRLDAQADAPAAPLPAPFSLATCEAWRRAAAALPLTDSAVRACAALRDWLNARGWSVSDRRWRLWMGVLRTAAQLEGRHAVDPWDLWMAPWVVSPGPDAVGAVQDWYRQTVAHANPEAAPWLHRAVEAFEKQAELEHSARQPDAADADNSAGKLALARAISQPLNTAIQDELAGNAANPNALRMESERLEAHRRQRYSAVHISARVAQVDGLIAHIEQVREPVDRHAEQLAAALHARSLWMPPSLAADLRAGPAATLAVLDGLRERLQRAGQVFSELPLDATLPDETPEPVAFKV